MSQLFRCNTLTLCVPESSEGRREAGAAGQVADQTQRKRQQGFDLLPDGQNVGYSC